MTNTLCVSTKSETNNNTFEISMGTTAYPLELNSNWNAS